MTPPRTRKAATTRAYCNECHGLKHHDILKKVATQGNIEVPDEDDEPVDYPDCRIESWMLQCRGCGAVCLRVRYRMISGEVETIQYPPMSFRRLPDWAHRLGSDQKGLLDEVYRALAADSRRLAMMGSRALIDRVLLDNVGDEGGFRQRLRSLVETGVISARESDVLATALEAGHAASHRGHLPSIEHLNDVMDIVEHLLRTVYVLPQTADRVAAHTPQRPRRMSQSAKVVRIDRRPEE